MEAGARSFPPAHLSHNNITAIPGQPQAFGLITRLGVEREQRSCFAESPNSPDLWSDPMNRTNEFLSPKQDNKLGKSALLMPPPTRCPVLLRHRGPHPSPGRILEMVGP
ncbi:hypothetical protein SynROS8604_03219 [Synechococcus sp. ROS8604]|jgi:hypothetical protein|nr:hypothetical protein SynROS8604_03219 [Synechococcus sp. ROS8604]